MATPLANQRVAQIFKHSPKNGLLVWTFWTTYGDPIKFFATRWTSTSESKKYEYTLGYPEMVESYNKLITGGDDTGSPYTEIEPLMSKEDIWELIKKCRARVEEDKKYKFKGN